MRSKRTSVQSISRAEMCGGQFFPTCTTIKSSFICTPCSQPFWPAINTVSAASCPCNIHQATVNSRGLLDSMDSYLGSAVGPSSPELKPWRPDLSAPHTGCVGEQPCDQPLRKEVPEDVLVLERTKLLDPQDVEQLESTHAFAHDDDEGGWRQSPCPDPYSNDPVQIARDQLKSPSSSFFEPRISGPAELYTNNEYPLLRSHQVDLISNAESYLLSRPPGLTPATISEVLRRTTGGYRCKVPGCNVPPFATQYLLNSHAGVHEWASLHYCTVPGCPREEIGKGFKRKYHLIRHGLVHGSPGFTCPFCPDGDHIYPRPGSLMRSVLRISRPWGERCSVLT